MHDDELELKVFQTECSSAFSYISYFKVDQNLDFMCEVEDGWWKGRLGGRVSACCASRSHHHLASLKIYLPVAALDTVPQVGVFPSNFVEMCEDDPPDPIKARTETIEELPLSSKVWISSQED